MAKAAARSAEARPRFKGDTDSCSGVLAAASLDVDSIVFVRQKLQMGHFSIPDLFVGGRGGRWRWGGGGEGRRRGNAGGG